MTESFQFAVSKKKTTQNYVGRVRDPRSGGQKNRGWECSFPFTKCRSQGECDTAWWRDVKKYGSKDVPWRVKCRRVGGPSVECILLRKWKLVPGRYEKKQRMGDEIIEKTLQDETVQG